MLQDNFTITTLDLSGNLTSGKCCNTHIHTVAHAFTPFDSADNPCQEANCEDFDHFLWRNRNYLSTDMENSPPSSIGPGSHTIDKSLTLTSGRAQDSRVCQPLSTTPASAARLRRISASTCLSFMSTANSPTSETSSPPVRSPSAPGGQLLFSPHPQADEDTEPCSRARSPSMSRALTPHRPVLQSIGRDAENQLNIAASARKSASPTQRYAPALQYALAMKSPCKDCLHSDVCSCSAICATCRLLCDALCTYVGCSAIWLQS